MAPSAMPANPKPTSDKNDRRLCRCDWQWQCVHVAARVMSDLPRSFDRDIRFWILDFGLKRSAHWPSYGNPKRKRGLFLADASRFLEEHSNVRLNVRITPIFNPKSKIQNRSNQLTSTDGNKVAVAK